MSESDGPRFLGGAPEPAAPAPPPARSPLPARAPIAPRREPPRAAAPEPAPETIAEPDWLARALGPGKMPRVMMAFPRISGVVLVLVGLASAYEVSRLSEEGGFYLDALPVLCTVGLFLGGWFVITGRPADARGYSPDWWNRGYVGALVAAGVAALAIAVLWL